MQTIHLLPALRLSLLATTVLSAGLTHAARPLAASPGWGGELALSAGFIGQKSQFNTDEDNAITSDLGQSGERVSTALPLPLGRIEYTSDDLNTQVFFGNSRDNVTQGQLALELGIRHQRPGLGRITAGLFPKLPFSGETWEDPYLSGQARRETAEKAYGGRLELDHAGGTPLSIGYAFAINRIDQELSGVSVGGLSPSDLDSLKRDGDYHRLQADFQIPLSRQFIIKPGIEYLVGNTDGSANAFEAPGLQLQTLYFTPQHFFTVNATLSRRLADADNPVFGKSNDGTQVSAFALYRYAEPFGWKNWSALALGFWEKYRSDIDFFDSETVGVGIGLGYTWQ